jgi:hypothetical protein
VFSVALSLALGAFAATLPASTVASGAAIAVCFAPEEDCAAFAFRAINNPEREILVGTYRLTAGSGIVEAVVRGQGARRWCQVDRGQDHALRTRKRDRALGRRGSADLD